METKFIKELTADYLERHMDLEREFNKDPSDVGLSCPNCGQSVGVQRLNSVAWTQTVCCVNCDRVTMSYESDRMGGTYTDFYRVFRDKIKPDSLKRFQFFSYYSDSDSSSEGGLYDIAAQADTLDEGLILLQNRDLSFYGYEFYWLDLDERRQSRADEVAVFLEKHKEVYLQRHPPEPARPLTPAQRAHMARVEALLHYKPDANRRLMHGTGEIHPLLWFFDPPRPPDTRTDAQKREDFLKSCRVK